MKAFAMLPLSFVLASVSCAGAPKDAALPDTIRTAEWPQFREHYPASDLCADDELTLWSCGVDTREFALCASHDMAPDSGHLQYRVADSGTLVFSYPERKQPAARHFSFVTFPNGDAAIGFMHQGQQYTVIDRLRGEGSVTMLDEDGMTRELDCSGNQTLQLNYTLRLMHEAGLWQH